MAIAIYPLSLSPSAVNLNYDSGRIMAVGGIAPYTFTISAGTLPPGIYANTDIANQLTLAGRPLIADQYANSPSANVPLLPQAPSFAPVLVNASTFTVHVVDSTPVTALTANQVYTIPVSLFCENEAISIFEMLKLVYVGDFYIVLADMGTRNIKIGDIGNAAFGGVYLVINAYLNSMSAGMVRRMREYVREFDRLKLMTQVQTNGGVEGITGISWSPKEKLCKLLEVAKTILPAYTNAEVIARQEHRGGSGFTGSITGESVVGGRSGSNIRLSR